MDNFSQQLMKDGMRRQNDSRARQLELIRLKCLEANPEIGACRICGDSVGEGICCARCRDVILGREVRLADVLLAMINNLHHETYEAHAKRLLGLVGETPWNLRADDLTQQSNDCVSFLVGLLAHTK